MGQGLLLERGGVEISKLLGEEADTDMESETMPWVETEAYRGNAYICSLGRTSHLVLCCIDPF